MADFTTPIPHRLTLQDGKFVDIYAELNHGQSEDMNARIWPGGAIDRRMVRTARILAYLLGWSLTKADPETTAEVPVPYSPDLPEQTRIDTLRALNQDRAVEIFDAIQAYEEAQATKKKIPAGAPADDKTSSSRSAPAGGSSGSVPSASTTTPTSSSSSGPPTEASS